MLWLDEKMENIKRLYKINIHDDFKYLGSIIIIQGNNVKMKVNTRI